MLGGGISHGGFGAVHLRVGDVKGERSLFLGGEAAWVPNHRLILGVGIRALVSENARVGAQPGEAAEGTPLWMGHAGVLVGYRIAPAALVHPTASLLIGAGRCRPATARARRTATMRCSSPSRRSGWS